MRVWLVPASVMVLLLSSLGVLALAARSGDVPVDYFDATTLPTQPPQTPLRDGLTVAAGSVLVGPVFPVLEDPASTALPGSGQIVSWRAHLLLTGDLLQVFNAYVSQAQAAGFPVVAACEVRDRSGVDVPLADFDAPTAQLLQCRAGYQLSSPDDLSSASLIITAERGIRDGVHVCGVAIYRVTVGGGTGIDPGPGIEPSQPILDEAPALPEPPPLALAKPGDRLPPDRTSAGVRVPDVRVPAASEQLAPATGAAVCSGGFDIVLSVHGAALPVLLDLRAQATFNRHPPAIRSSSDGGVAVHTLTVPSVGGSGSLYATSVEVDGAGYVLVTVC